MSDDLFAWADRANPAMRDRIARIEAKRPKEPRKSIDERCADFDAARPEVYAELRRLALWAVARGRKRIGIAQLVEVARWNLDTEAKDADGYKLNNDFRAVWARRLMAEEPALAGVFETRERTAS